MQDIWDKVIEQRRRVEYARLLTRYADDELEAVNLWYHEQELMYSLHQAAKHIAEVEKYEKTNATELRTRLGMNDQELEKLQSDEAWNGAAEWTSKRSPRSKWRGIKKWHHSLIVNWFGK